ncbi:hypothetical protein, partial [Paracoccus sp. MKU1]|uniref:hypothetical protein n=1 Tax=Paracoccus sp. MKU1 TaxID=1745182 RepID=UPI00193D1323
IYSKSPFLLTNKVISGLTALTIIGFQMTPQGPDLGKLTLCGRHSVARGASKNLDLIQRVSASFSIFHSKLTGKNKALKFLNFFYSLVGSKRKEFTPRFLYQVQGLHHLLTLPRRRGAYQFVGRSLQRKRRLACLRAAIHRFRRQNYPHVPQDLRILTFQ